MPKHYRRSVSMSPTAYILLYKLVGDGSRSGWVEKAIRDEARRQGISVSASELMEALELADHRKRVKRALKLAEQEAAFPAPAADILL